MMELAFIVLKTFRLRFRDYPFSMKNNIQERYLLKARFDFGQPLDLYPGFYQAIVIVKTLQNQLHLQLLHCFCCIYMVNNNLFSLPFSLKISSLPETGSIESKSVAMKATQKKAAQELAKELK